MVVHFERSYWKQGHEQELSSDIEVSRAMGTDRNQFGMGLSGQEEIVQNRRGCHVVFLQNC